MESLKHNHEIAFIPDKGKDHDGELIFRDNKAKDKFKIHVKNFDPVAVGLKRYCCKGDLHTCRVVEDGWCHSDEVIVWRNHYISA